MVKWIEVVVTLASEVKSTPSIRRRVWIVGYKEGVGIYDAGLAIVGIKKSRQKRREEGRSW
jgi:hypothetical protein